MDRKKANPMNTFYKYLAPLAPILLPCLVILTLSFSINWAFSLTPRQAAIAKELGATPKDFIAFTCGLKSMCKDFQHIAIACASSTDPDACFDLVGGGSLYLCDKVGNPISSKVASVPPSTLQCVPYIADRLLSNHVRPDLFLKK
jgi:hypothetical protein